MDKSKWVWMPHPGHFICSSQCRFVLNTYVGKYIVSTVGEYVPDSVVQKILFESRLPDRTLERGDLGEDQFIREHGFVELGFGRTYETMVFQAHKSKEKCCPWVQKPGAELDMQGYSNASEAYAGHLRMCRIWAAKGRAGVVKRITEKELSRAIKKCLKCHKTFKTHVNGRREIATQKYCSQKCARHRAESAMKAAKKKRHEEWIKTLESQVEQGASPRRE